MLSLPYLDVIRPSYITLACHVTECNRSLCCLKITFFHIAILWQMQLIVQPFYCGRKSIKKYVLTKTVILCVKKENTNPCL